MLAEDAIKAAVKDYKMKKESQLAAETIPTL